MTPYLKIANLAFGCLATCLILLSSAVRDEARPIPMPANRTEARVQRLTVVDYFNLLPTLGIGYPGTRQEKRELLQPGNHPIVDVGHDYMLVHPDASPAEQIAVFRARREAALVAVSLPDFQGDYNGFALYHLYSGRLRDVTRQMLPMPVDTDHFLYELPRFGSTIHVFRFSVDKQWRHHVFDLQWRGGRFVRVP